MRIIALMNQKGGVGKTTTTVNLGAALAEQGKRVCLIDLDPQAHLTINYGVEPSGDHVSLYDVLIDDRSFLEAVHKIDNNVALVPSSIDLAGAEIELVNVIGRETLLKRKLEDAQHDFDFILIDCPPSLGLLTLNALSVASEVIIPMQPHFLALQGVAKLLETVQLVSQRINAKLKVSGIVLTMYDAQTKLSSEVVAELNGFIAAAQGKPLPWANAKVFGTKIRRNIKLAESPSFGQTILKYDGASNGAFDYRNLARELLGIAPVARPAVKAPAAVPVTTRAVATGSLPPKPVMPAALVGALKAQAAKKGAVSAKPQVTPAQRPVVGAANSQTSPPLPAKAPTAPPPPSAGPAASSAAPPASAPTAAAPAPTPTPALVLTPPLPAKPAASANPAPSAATAVPAAAAAKVSVEVNPKIEPSKLAASNATPRPAAPPVAKPATRSAPTAVSAPASSGPASPAPASSVAPSPVAPSPVAAKAPEQQEVA